MTGEDNMTKELKKLESMIKAEIATLEEESKTKDHDDIIRRCNRRIGLRTALTFLYQVAIEEVE